MNKMLMKKASLSLFIFCFYLLFVSLKNVAVALNDEEEIWGSSVVKKEERRVFSSSENGEVTGVKVSDGRNGTYLLQFITMETNALFLPVLLHADMLFYVHSGSGRLSYIGEDEDETISLDLQRGDVYILKYGTVFFIESNLEAERQKLRICSIFATSNDDIRHPSTGPYSSIRDMLLGFDEKILQAAFKVPEEVIDEIKSGTTQPLIVHGMPKSIKTVWEAEAQFINGLMHRRKYNMFDNTSNKKRKTKLFNFLISGDRDVENCNGWSTTVTGKKLKALKDSDMGVFMVNLTKGSMMGPHWNPRATEIAIVVRGQGMVRVVCSNGGKECENKRFKVEEGDVFVVPRFQPMAQMSFNNDTFVFVGFSTASGKNHPQFLAGKSSVLQTLQREVLARSFNVPNTTIDQLLAPQSESVILECTSCAEEEERKMEEQVERQREEERKREEEKRREEEARRREKARRREEEEEEEEEEKAKRKEEAEEEEARREEEEKRKREEEEEEEAEETRREEKEKRRREVQEEEEKARQREEEKRRRKEQEEERRREEQKEEEARREQEEEEGRMQEEEKRRGEEEEEEEEARREEEESQARKEKEEEEEAATRRREEQEEEEGEQTKGKTQREEEAREEEEAARRQEEEREVGGKSS